MTKEELLPPSVFIIYHIVPFCECRLPHKSHFVYKQSKCNPMSCEPVFRLTNISTLTIVMYFFYLFSLQNVDKNIVMHETERVNL